MKQIQLFIIIAIFLLQGCGSAKSAYSVDDFQCYPDAVYLFRHAEKQKIKGEKNPELTKNGFIRAEALADSLSSIQNGIIFSSEFKRTQQTVNPLSREWDSDLIIHTAMDAEGQIEMVIGLCNKTVIISGHSNTIPNLIKLFGIVEEVKIEDEQYGDLYKIEWFDRSPKLTITHIGV
jgi:phosphohistidine phosphatase SixA